jgi:dTDP-4-amino-4,6-dideoxygalactose transaminase
MQVKVPFLDLYAAHVPLLAEINAAIGAVISYSAFAGGPFVAAFEQEFAAYTGARDAVGVGNGTDALGLVLRALEIGPGDEVITVPNSFFATAEAISYSGATPVFVDVDAGTYNMDPVFLKRALTPRTRALIPVHLFGQAADLDPIRAFAAEHGLFLLEDAAQAVGAEYKGVRIGAGGTAAFSFYPGKNLGALGEAGAVVTDDPALAEKVRMLREHGQAKKYEHALVGWNCRMDGIQAAVLSVKLRYLSAANEARRRHAAFYDAALAPFEAVRRPFAAPYGRHVYHIYAVRVPNRDEVLRALADRGIVCGVHYPVPIHLQAAYRHLGYRPGAFPVAERCAVEFLSLPMFPELTREQCEAVISGLAENV